MVSNEFTQKFKANVDGSKGMYCNFSFAQLSTFIRTIRKTGDNYDALVCRDAMHTPQTLFGIL